MSYLVAKLSFVLCRELDMQFNFVYLCTDAVVVLRYFGNVVTLIEMFIANRIELLRIQVPLSNGSM